MRLSAIGAVSNFPCRWFQNHRMENLVHYTLKTEWKNSQGIMVKPAVIVKYLPVLCQVKKACAQVKQDDREYTNNLDDIMKRKHACKC